VSEILNIGHRHRLRERFVQSQTNGMHEYEVLELLLTYAIPRRDVKPIAKELTARFGSLHGVLDAHQEELKEIPYVGATSVTLIKLVKDVCCLYLAGRMEKKDVLNTPSRVVQFATMKLAGLPHEAFMALFLNTQNELLAYEIVNEGTIDQVAVYPRRVVEKALTHHAAGLILVHNHPSGYAEPSEDDRRLTRSLKEASQLFDIRVLDHLIVARNGSYSFLENGLL
jgi:DNA repair protein RadC